MLKVFNDDSQRSELKFPYIPIGKRKEFSYNHIQCTKNSAGFYGHSNIT